MSKSGDRGCLGADKGSDLLNGNKSGKADRYKLYRRLFPSEHIFRTVLHSLVYFFVFRFIFGYICSDIIFYYIR